MNMPSNRGNGRSAWRGFAIIELSLAVSVIFGLVFVTLRVINMPLAKPTAEAAQSAMAPEAGAPTATAAVTTQTPATVPETRNP